MFVHNTDTPSVHGVQQLPDQVVISNSCQDCAEGTCSCCSNSGAGKWAGVIIATRTTRIPVAPCFQDNCFHSHPIRVEQENEYFRTHARTHAHTHACVHSICKNQMIEWGERNKTLLRDWRIMSFFQCGAHCISFPGCFPPLSHYVTGNRGLDPF